MENGLKMVEKWVTKGDNSNVPHTKCIGSEETTSMEPKTCQNGPKVGSGYMPTSKTSHCMHGIPIIGVTGAIGFN